MLPAVVQALHTLNSRQDDDVTDRLHYFITSNILIALSVLISFKQFGGKPIDCTMLQVLLNSLHYLNARHDDDFSDNLHYFITSNLLIMLSILLSFKQFGGKPVECMVPNMFPGGWEQYVENYCWAQDTFYLPFEEEVPEEDEYRVQDKDKRVSYYQWVPFLLLISALFFRLPSLVWKYMAAHSGISIHDIVKVASDPRNLEANPRKENITSLTIHLQNALRFHRRLFRKRVQPHRVLRFMNLPYNAFYVTFVYLLTKLLYLANVVFQLWLMNFFLGTTRHSFYGFGALSDIINGTTWSTSGLFPRVTLCDFWVRVTGNVQRHSVQCVLVINIFTEKIFVFLWFWYLMLMVCTGISFFYWLIVMSVQILSHNFISRHLELSDLPYNARDSRKDVDRFVRSYLRTDGIFVLRMITMHAGIIFGTDLVTALYRSFYGYEQTVREQSRASAPALTPGSDIQTLPEKDKFNVLRLRNPFSQSDKTGDKAAKKTDKDLMDVLTPSKDKDRAVTSALLPKDGRRTQSDRVRRKSSSSESDKSDQDITDGDTDTERQRLIEKLKKLDNRKSQKEAPVLPKKYSMDETLPSRAALDKQLQQQPPPIPPKPAVPPPPSATELGGRASQL